MNSARIKKIQSETAWPDSMSVHQALLKVWNETQQQLEKEITDLKQRLEALEEVDDIAGSYRDLAARAIEEIHSWGIHYQADKLQKEFNEIGE